MAALVTFLKAVENTRAVLKQLDTQLSLTASNAVSLTGTEDVSGDLESRINSMATVFQAMMTDLGMTNGSLLS